MIYASIAMNAVFAIVIFLLVRRSLDLYSRVEESFLAMESFRDHLNTVHNLDTFYGDDTLGALIEHSKELSDFLREVQQENLQIDEGKLDEEERET